MSFAIVLISTGPLGAVMMPTGAAATVEAGGKHFAVYKVQGHLRIHADGQFLNGRMFDTVERAQAWIESQ